MIFIDYQKKLTPRGAEPKHTLRAQSFVFQIFFEATVLFQRWFASSSCFRKAWHFLWCCVRPLADKAVNLSAQYLHGNMIRNPRQSQTRFVILTGMESCPGMSHVQGWSHIRRILGTLKDINLDLLARNHTIHSQHLHDCNSLSFLPRHESTPASFVVPPRANIPRAYARRHQKVA